jgi:hypothetical protein
MHDTHKEQKGEMQAVVPAWSPGDTWRLRRLRNSATGGQQPGARMGKERTDAIIKRKLDRLREPEVVRALFAHLFSVPKRNGKRVDVNVAELRIPIQALYEVLCFSGTEFVQYKEEFIPAVVRCGKGPYFKKRHEIKWKVSGVVDDACWQADELGSCSQGSNVATLVYAPLQGMPWFEFEDGNLMLGEERTCAMGVTVLGMDTSRLGAGEDMLHVGMKD